MANEKPIIPIDSLPEAQILNDSDTTVLVQGGTITKQVELSNISDFTATKHTYDSLNTNSKDIIGAVNELKGLEFQTTLYAYQTTITIQDPRIPASGKVKVFTNIFGIPRTGMEINNGYVMVQFEPQSEDVGVLIEIT